MEQTELNEILAQHKLWLEDNTKGKRANLSNADLRNADLRNANLDYASFPLWCGSLDAKLGEANCAQLAYHLARAMQASGMEVHEVIASIANKAPQIERHNLPRIGG